MGKEGVPEPRCAVGPGSRVQSRDAQHVRCARRGITGYHWAPGSPCPPATRPLGQGLRAWSPGRRAVRAQGVCARPGRLRACDGCPAPVRGLSGALSREIPGVVCVAALRLSARKPCPVRARARAARRSPVARAGRRTVCCPSPTWLVRVADSRRRLAKIRKFVTCAYFSYSKLPPRLARGYLETTHLPAHNFCVANLSPTAHAECHPRGVQAGERCCGNTAVPAHCDRLAGEHVLDLRASQTPTSRRAPGVAKAAWCLLIDTAARVPSRLIRGFHMGVTLPEETVQRTSRTCTLVPLFHA